MCARMHVLVSVWERHNEMGGGVLFMFFSFFKKKYNPVIESNSKSFLAKLVYQEMHHGA